MNNTIRQIKKILENPYYENDFGLIYNVDCLKVMKLLPNELISQTFTSSPYNIGKEYEKILPISEYIEWCKNWINEIYRITKKNGSFWLNVGYLQIPDLGNAIPIAY